MQKISLEYVYGESLERGQRHFEGLRLYQVAFKLDNQALQANLIALKSKYI